MKLFTEITWDLIREHKVKKTMLPLFQQYLVDKGFKRTCTEHCGKKEIEDYSSLSLSSYTTLYYEFREGDLFCWWGLSEHGKPPVMYLGDKKINVITVFGNFKSKDDGYRILFSKWKEDKFDEIYNCLNNKESYFEIDCVDENDIKISIKIKN